MSATTERLERPKKQEAQLKPHIQQEQARISASASKERDGKLISWGVAVEQLILDGKVLERTLVAEKKDNFKKVQFMVITYLFN